MGEGRVNAKSPADLYSTFVFFEHEDIAIDTFRTTLWRMKGRTFKVGEVVYEVEGDDGTYWKVQQGKPDAAPQMSGKSARISDWINDDSEVPF